jgi:hypothetical protein
VFEAGVPDIIAIKNGRCYALELKERGGRLTPVQRDAHAALVAAGAAEDWDGRYPTSSTRPSTRQRQTEKLVDR